jgi:hypothetical protein
MKSRNMFTEVFQSSHEISLEDSQLPNTFQVQTFHFLLPLLETLSILVSLYPSPFFDC